MTTSNMYQFINLEYMELMADNDSSMKKIMLEMLLDELPEELQKMHSLLESENWGELGNVSHKMKSTLAYVGNDTMTVANKTVETLCKAVQDVELIPELVNTLQKNYELILPELQSELTKL